MSEVLMEELLSDEDRFVVDDDQKADWCLQKIREAEEEKKFWKAHYDEQYAKVCTTCDDTINAMTERLKVYFQTVPHKKTKTGQEKYPLPTATLVLKHQEPEYTVKDEELLPWLEKNAPDFIKVKRSADWAALKKTLVVSGSGMITEDAEMVPGIVVTPREDIFKVEVK